MIAMQILKNSLYIYSIREVNSCRQIDFLPVCNISPPVNKILKGFLKSIFHISKFIKMNNTKRYIT